MAAFCVSCGCRVNSNFECGVKVPETSLSGTGSTPEEENASSSSSLLRRRSHCPNFWSLKPRNVADSASQTKVLKGKRATRDPLPKEVLTTEL